MKRFQTWVLVILKHVRYGKLIILILFCLLNSHPRSPITRCQRLGVIMSTVLSTMLASMIFYELESCVRLLCVCCLLVLFYQCLSLIFYRLANEEQFETFELRSREFIIAMESAVVETLIRLSVNAFFQ